MHHLLTLAVLAAFVAGIVLDRFVFNESRAIVRLAEALELNSRKKLAADVAIALDDIRGWAANVDANGKAVLGQVEGRLKQLL